MQSTEPCIGPIKYWYGVKQAIETDMFLLQCPHYQELNRRSFSDPVQRRRRYRRSLLRFLP